MGSPAAAGVASSVVEVARGDLSGSTASRSGPRRVERWPGGPVESTSLRHLRTHIHRVRMGRHPSEGWLQPRRPKSFFSILAGWPTPVAPAVPTAGRPLPRARNDFYDDRPMRHSLDGKGGLPEMSLSRNRRPWVMSFFTRGGHPCRRCRRSITGRARPALTTPSSRSGPVGLLPFSAVKASARPTSSLTSTGIWNRRSGWASLRHGSAFGSLESAETSGPLARPSAGRGRPRPKLVE